MPDTSLSLLKRFAEFLPKDRAQDVPDGHKGLYVLYDQPEGTNHSDVVYVGRATNCIKSRVLSHKGKEIKGERWTHFSAFEVRDRITDDEIIELEGLIRHIFRKDSSAMRFNDQRSWKQIEVVRKDNLEEWT
jgi:hypothetical protein